MNQAAKTDLMMIAFVALAFAILEFYFDGFEIFLTRAAQTDSFIFTEAITLAIVLSIGFLIYSGRRLMEVRRLIEDRARLQETIIEEQSAKQTMQSYAEAVMHGQEAERSRLARELHDDTIQQLVFLNQRVELAAFDHADSAIAGDLNEMEDVIGGIIRGLRGFIQALRPTYLDELGLVAALGALAKATRAQTDLFIEFESRGDVCRLDESVQLALYRIAQSALSNVVQHADASAVEMQLDFRPKETLLTIQDDGIGFEQTADTEFAKDGHFGLIGMRERAQLLGGEVRIFSVSGEGTLVSVSIPR